MKFRKPNELGTVLPRPAPQSGPQSVPHTSSCHAPLTLPHAPSSLFPSQVDQLHVHITGRAKGDPSWPGPCYGATPAVPLGEAALGEAVQKLRAALAAKHTLFTADASI